MLKVALYPDTLRAPRSPEASARRLATLSSPGARGTSFGPARQSTVGTYFLAALAVHYWTRMLGDEISALALVYRPT